MNNKMYDYYNYMNNYETSNIPNSIMPNATNSNIVMTNTNILDPYTSFIKGNSFNNLYDKYKDYKIQEIKTDNQKKALLLEIMQYYFVLVDLDLYLDIYTNDQSIIKLYNDYLTNYKKLVNEYQKNYGPLSITSNYLNNNSWIWVDNPWPWEGES